ncbi:MAG: AAA family ATPase [Chitinivibrionales bacterium]|nr:AAA family ATPase [Chitinivibrionales bacterium]MBD3397216.1 AAA family ATPase [Chitinivibrionales bacterium]
MQRRLKESRLPLEKSFETFDLKRLDRRQSQSVAVLREGDFVDRRESVLAFSHPGAGKTHLLAAIAQELIMAGRRVLFAPCSLLVQELLRAKVELHLDKHLKKLSHCEALLIDDIGYVQQNREEMEVTTSGKF